MCRLWAAGAAIVVCLLSGGLPVLGQEASPSGVTGDVLYAITVPAESIPIGLVKIPVDQWTIAPGVDAVTSLSNEAIRGRGCLVRSGTLVVRPVTDSQLWRAGDAVHGPSSVAPGGEPVALELGDVLLLPAIPEAQVDPATKVGLANPGSTEAVVFCFHMHQPGGAFSGWPDGIESTAGVTYYDADDMHATEAAGALFRLTQLTAQVGDVIALPADAAYAIYIVDQGRIRSSTGGPTWTPDSGWWLSARTDPATQIEVVGEEPAVVLELAVIPAGQPAPGAPSSTDGTPEVVPSPAE